MSQIPKGLSDKEMFQNYVEEISLEDRLVTAEKAAEQKRRESAGIEPPAELGRAGFTPALTEELGKALLQLKMEFYRSGITSYSFKIRRDGENIVLTPKYKNK